MGSFCKKHQYAYAPMILLAVALLPSAIGQTATAKKHPSSTKEDDQAEMRLRFRLQDNPHDKDAHKQLQKLLDNKYAFRAQLVEYASWLKNNPYDFEAELSMHSIATVAIDDPEFAIAEDKLVLSYTERRADPDSYDSVEERMAFDLLKRRRYEEGLKLLKHQTQVRAEDAGAWEDFGLGQLQAGNPIAAIEAYQRSIAIDGNQETAHKGLSEAFLKQKDYRHAETELIAAIAIYNSQYHGAAPTDSFHAMLKRMQEATHTEPTLSELHRRLAMVYRAEGKLEKAISEIDIASKTDDGFSEYFLKASLYEEAGQVDKAATTRQQAHAAIAAEMKKEAPKKSITNEFSNLDVIFLSGDDEDVESAPQVISLLESQSTTGKVTAMDRLLLGRAYCAMGKPLECKREEEAAFRLENKLDTGNSEHTLGLALLAGKDEMGALGHLQRAYELDPQNITYRMDYEQVGNKGQSP